MLRTPVLALCLAVILLPSLAYAHPPAADAQNACQGLPVRQGIPTPPVPVQGTLSYVAAPGTSLPCGGPEWGSHAPACPLPVGPIPGAYCGPIVPPGGTATCTWAPVVNTIPTALTIGFDQLVFNGLIQFPEGPVTMPLPPGAWTVTNPGALPERVIAYPTNPVVWPGPAPAGFLAPGDLNNVICVTP